MTAGQLNTVYFKQTTGQGRLGTATKIWTNKMSEPTLAAGAAANEGSEPTTNGTPEATVGNEQGGESNGFNPAWNSLLEKLPKEFHNLIAPDLKQWDQNFQSKTSEVQSRYEPYNQFLENNVKPEDIEQALQITALINTNPKAFYEQMGNFYKDEWGQGQQEDPPGEQEFSLGDPEFDLDKAVMEHPVVKQMQERLDVLGQYLAQEVTTKQSQEAEQKLDAEIKDLTTKHGEFDEEWVLSYAMTHNMPLEDSVKAYGEFVNKIRQTPTANDTAPSVLTPSGAVPSQQPNIANMGRKETRNLIADIVARASQES